MSQQIQTPPVQAAATPPPDDTHLQLREWMGIVRLRKWSILALTLLVVGAAMFLSFRMTPVYEASTRVLVEPIQLNPTQPIQEQLDMETESELAASSLVAQLVVDNLQLDTAPEGLLSDLTVEPVEGSTLLLFSYQDTDPSRARSLSQAFARHYIKFRQERALEELEARNSTLTDQIAERQGEADELQVQLDALPPDSSELATIQSQLNSVLGTIQTLRNQMFEVPNINAGQVVEPAQLPTTPTRPNHILNGIIALLVGAALGVGIAFLRERLDDRLRGKEDLGTRAGAPVLAVIPKIPWWKRRNETPIVTTTEPRSAAAEAYRTLRTNVLFSASQFGIQTIMLTSPHAGEGKTATSSNLAATLAQAGKRVIVIDADLRKPRLHKFFKGEQQPGLTEILSGEVEPWEVLFEPEDMPTLRVLTSGKLPGNPAEMLGSDAMGQLIDRLSEASDFVLIDTSPVLVASDPLILAAFSDAVLFTADAERTTRGAVDSARQQLEQVNARVIGAIFNNFDPSKAKTSPYYYQYYYTYQQYGAAPPEDGNGARAGGARRARRST